HFRLLLEERQIVQQQVTEVAGIERGQPLLIGRIDLETAPTGEVPDFSSRDDVRCIALVLPLLDQGTQRLGRPSLFLQSLRRHDLLQEAKLVIAIQDGEVGLETHPLCFLAQNACRERVEGAEPPAFNGGQRSEEHTSELQSRENLVCRLLLEKKKQ